MKTKEFFQITKRKIGKFWQQFLFRIRNSTVLSRIYHFLRASTVNFVSWVKKINKKKLLLGIGVILGAVAIFYAGYYVGKNDIGFTKNEEPRISKEDRIQRIEEERTKRLADKEKATATVTQSIKPTDSSSAKPTPATTTTTTIVSTGKIVALTKNSITVQESNQKRVLYIAEKSVFVDSIGKSIDFSALKINDIISSIGYSKDGKFYISRLKRN